MRTNIKDARYLAALYRRNARPVTAVWFEGMADEIVDLRRAKKRLIRAHRQSVERERLLQKQLRDLQPEMISWAEAGIKSVTFEGKKIEGAD